MVTRAAVRGLRERRGDELGGMRAAGALGQHESSRPGAVTHLPALFSHLGALHTASDPRARNPDHPAASRRPAARLQRLMAHYSIHEPFPQGPGPPWAGNRCARRRALQKRAPAFRGGTARRSHGAQQGWQALRSALAPLQPPSGLSEPRPTAPRPQRRPPPGPFEDGDDEYVADGPGERASWPVATCRAPRSRRAGFGKCEARGSAAATHSSAHSFICSPHHPCLPAPSPNR